MARQGAFFQFPVVEVFAGETVILECPVTEIETRGGDVVWIGMLPDRVDFICNINQTLVLRNVTVTQETLFFCLPGGDFRATFGLIVLGEPHPSFLAPPNY